MPEYALEPWQLKQRQSLPLKTKIELSKSRIQSFIDGMDGDVYVSFSGGKDSTVLTHLVHEIDPSIPLVFGDTGLEYPEIRDFVKTFDNVEWLRPKKTFKKVFEEYGFPVVSKEISHFVFQARNTNSDVLRKRLMDGINKDGSKSKFKISKKWKFLVDAPFKISERCCDILKKNPFKAYEKKNGRKPFIGTMAMDSRLRKRLYLESGCNNFKEGKQRSTPLGFWTEEDIWNFIRSKNIPYCNIYDMGINNTGCMFCMFGLARDGEPNRFQLMEKTHPKLHSYCMFKLGLKDILKYMGYPWRIDKKQKKIEQWV